MDLDLPLLPYRKILQSLLAPPQAARKRGEKGFWGHPNPRQGAAPPGLLLFLAGCSLRNWLKVQDNVLNVWIDRRAGGGIRMFGVGPANEFGRAVLIPVGFSRQWDAGQLLYHNLL